MNFYDDDLDVLDDKEENLSDGLDGDLVKDIYDDYNDDPENEYH